MGLHSCVEEVYEKCSCVETSFQKVFFKDEVKEKSYHQKACVSLLLLRQKKSSPRHIHGFFLHTLGADLEQALLSQDYDSK